MSNLPSSFVKSRDSVYYATYNRCSFGLNEFTYYHRLFYLSLSIT